MIDKLGSALTGWDAGFERTLSWPILLRNIN
jgi:hypothetical protein